MSGQTENRVEYRPLSRVSLECIHETFLQSFSDYQVPMKMSLEYFERLMRRNGFRPELSAGAFAEGRLVGIVLNGMRIRDGARTIYDTGTGVVPEYRGSGVGDGLLKYIDTLCAQNQVETYLLEVIQNNDSAVHLYEKQGFLAKRGLNCYSLKGRPTIEAKPAVCVEDGQLRYREIAMDKVPWEHVERFWDYAPSWQNDQEAVRAVSDSFICLLAEWDGALIGYGIAGKKNGDIAQLAVDKAYRRRGVAASILQELQSIAQSRGMTALNVDEHDEGMNAFLNRMGFQLYLTQYEMEKKISDSEQSAFPAQIIGEKGEDIHERL